MSYKRFVIRNMIIFNIYETAFKDREDVKIQEIAPGTIQPTGCSESEFPALQATSRLNFTSSTRH